MVDKTKTIYESVAARVPVTAHTIIKRVAKKKGIRISEAYVMAARDYAKNNKVKV